MEGQTEAYKTAAEAALKKEQRATHLVTELTAIVREQKGRLDELTRAKQSSLQELKVRGGEDGGRERVSVVYHVLRFLCRMRISELERDTREKHRLEVKVQTLQEVPREYSHPTLSLSPSPPDRISPGSAHSCRLRSQCWRG